MKNKSVPLAIVLLTMVLGLSSVPVRACEEPVHEDIQHTVYDPTDNIHFRQTAL